MTTAYPGGLDSLKTNINGATDTLQSVPHDAQHNDANAAINAIEATLGTNPQGTYSTVADRLDAGANTLTAGTATTGAPGTAMSFTITGEAPNQVLNMTVPRGDAGSVTAVAGVAPDAGGNVDLSGVVPLLDVDGLVSPAQIPSGGLGLVRGRDGQTYRVVAGALRNDGSGWAQIGDPHVSSGIDSISVVNGGIVVDYTSVGASKVVSFVAVPDESFALAGFNFGASVGLTSAMITGAVVANSVSDYISWNGSAFVSLNGVFTFGAWDGTNKNVKIMYPSKVQYNSPFAVAITPRGATSTRASDAGGGFGADGCFVSFFNSAGLMSAPDSTCKFTLTKSIATAKVDLGTVTTATLPNSNIWVLGIFVV